MAKKLALKRDVSRWAGVLVQKDAQPSGFAEAKNEMLVDTFVQIERERVESVLSTARRSGLLEEKTGRISGRISPALLDQAKRRTGIESDTDLIEFALANLALEDDFADAFRQARGTVDPSVKLGF